MRLTRQTNYAMRILMYCAANDGRLSRIPEIASAYSVSELFLFKILQPLVEARLVQTVRGRNGGVRLGRAADQITLFDVVRVTEENFAMAECFENDATECPLVDSCALNSALREALNAFFEVLMRHSIADLVAERPGMRGLLGIELPTQPQALARYLDCRTAKVLPTAVARKARLPQAGRRPSACTRIPWRSVRRRALPAASRRPPAGRDA